MFKFTDNNQIKAGKCGIIGEILNVMKTHISSPAVCKQGCGALWSITSNNSENNAIKIMSTYVYNLR